MLPLFLVGPLTEAAQTSDNLLFFKKTCWKQIFYTFAP